MGQPVCPPSGLFVPAGMLWFTNKGWHHFDTLMCVVGPLPGVVCAFITPLANRCTRPQLPKVKIYKKTDVTCRWPFWAPPPSRRRNLTPARRRVQEAFCGYNGLFLEVRLYDARVGKANQRTVQVVSEPGVRLPGDPSTRQTRLHPTSIHV